MADATCSSSASTLKTLIRQGDTTQHVGHQDRPILIRAGLDSIEVKIYAQVAMTV